MSGSAVRLSDTCCQTVGESAVSAVRLSGTVRRCPGFAVRLSDQGSEHESHDLLAEKLIFEVLVLGARLFTWGLL